MKPTDRQRVLRFLGDPPAARTRDELMIKTSGVVNWDDDDLSDQDFWKVIDAAELLATMVEAGELSRENVTLGDRVVVMLGPPQQSPRPDSPAGGS